VDSEKDTYKINTKSSRRSLGLPRNELDARGKPRKKSSRLKQPFRLTEDNPRDVPMEEENEGSSSTTESGLEKKLTRAKTAPNIAASSKAANATVTTTATGTGTSPKRTRLTSAGLPPRTSGVSGGGGSGSSGGGVSGSTGNCNDKSMKVASLRSNSRDKEARGGIMKERSNSASSRRGDKEGAWDRSMSNGPSEKPILVVEIMPGEGSGVENGKDVSHRNPKASKHYSAGHKAKKINKEEK